jgi:hypothetical protein
MMEKIKEDRKEIKKDEIEKKRRKKNNPVVYTAKYDCVHVCSMKFYLAI